MKGLNAKPACNALPKSTRPIPAGKKIPQAPIDTARKVHTHEALRDLNDVQIADLALLGLRYRALGADAIDFSDPSRLDVYWTGKRMAEDAVKKAVKAAKGKSPLTNLFSGRAEGHLMALLNCSVISTDIYMEQYGLLLKLSKGGVQ